MKQRVEQIMGRGNRSILVHIGTNNADKKGTTATAIVEKYRVLLKRTKLARIGLIINYYQDFFTSVYRIRSPG